MNILYLDLISGMSGDMFVGALIDLGADFTRLEADLGTLKLGGYHLHAARKRKSSIEGVKFDVHLSEDSHSHSHSHPHPESSHRHEHAHEDHGHAHSGHDHSHSPREESDNGHQAHGERHAAGHGASPAEPHDHSDSRDYTQIRELIAESPFSDWVKQRATAVFHRIAVAEGKVHGVPPDQVHFHEVGAVDSIVDILGACLALEQLGRPRVLSSSVVEGTGWVNCAHGRFPIPTTATLEILGARGIAISQCEEPHELVTPTGAALLAEFAESFAPMQNLVARRIGYGLGTRDHLTRPNVLRAILGELASPAATGANDWEIDTIAVLETNLDDASAEILGHCAERLLAAGALDVYYTPVQMKKSRPGVLLTVLCETTRADQYTEMLLRETSSFGIRRSTLERRKLKREIIKVQTLFGPVPFKVGRLNRAIVQAAPEFEACKQLAANARKPLKEIYDAALCAAREQFGLPH